MEGPPSLKRGLYRIRSTGNPRNPQSQAGAKCLTYEDKSKIALGNEDTNPLGSQVWDVVPVEQNHESYNIKAYLGGQGQDNQYLHYVGDNNNSPVVRGNEKSFILHPNPELAGVYLIGHYKSPMGSLACIGTQGDNVVTRVCSMGVNSEAPPVWEFIPVPLPEGHTLAPLPWERFMLPGMPGYNPFPTQ